MMRLLTAILLFFIGCMSPTKPYSYWEGQKNSFRYFNKNEFVSDSALKTDLRNLTKINHPLFKQISSTGVYLYSWQQRGDNTNEFTVIDDEGEYGLEIYYYILDKRDSLISYKWIAGQDNEGIEGFMKKSMVGKDTILTIRYAASGYHPATKKMFVPGSSDSSHYTFAEMFSKEIILEEL